MDDQAETKRFCEICGNELNNDSKYCSNCGYKVMDTLSSLHDNTIEKIERNIHLPTETYPNVENKNLANEISDNVKQDNSKNINPLSILILIVLLIVLVGIVLTKNGTIDLASITTKISNLTDKKKVNSYPTGGNYLGSNYRSTSTPVPTPVLGTMGAPVTDAAFSYTANKFECGKSEFESQTANGQFCVIYVTVKNISRVAQSLDYYYSYLFDVSQSKYDINRLLSSINPRNDLFNTVNPGLTVNEVLVFDIPKNTTPTYIELHNSKTSIGVKINLQ